MVVGIIIGVVFCVGLLGWAFFVNKREVNNTQDEEGTDDKNTK